MSKGGRDSMFDAIDETLAGVVEALPEKPDWLDAWRRLGHDASDEQRLAVYRAIRRSGVIPEDAGFYLVSWQLDEIVNVLAETSLREIDERLEAIEAAHGMGEWDVFEPGEAPPEYEELLRRHDRAWDDLFATQLERHGEPAMARLFREDPDEFSRRSEAGRRYFFGAIEADDGAVPAWLDTLVDVVAAAMEAQSPLGPLGFVYREDEGFWEIDVYATPVELVGGADDGAVVLPVFSLDLERLRSQFARVDDMGWNAWGWVDGEGPFVWIEGTFHGQDLFLRVLAQAPEGEAPGAKLRLPRKEPG